jgi:hypothetical protein
MSAFLLKFSYLYYHVYYTAIYLIYNNSQVSMKSDFPSKYYAVQYDFEVYVGGLLKSCKQ